MYRVLESLRKPDETNEQLAARLGIEVNRRGSTGKIDQTDLSRTFSDKWFRRVCAGLKKYAMEHPEEWLLLLASARAGSLWDEFKDLIFLSEDFWKPSQDLLVEALESGKLTGLPKGIQLGQRLKAETWIVTGEPSVLESAGEREFSTARIKIGHRFVYWLPKGEGQALARRIVAEFRFSGVLSSEELNHGLWFIYGPETLGYMPAFAISSPHSERALGLTGTRNEASNIRLIVLPEQLTTRTISWMRGVYIELVEHDVTTTADGFEWRLVKGEEAG